MSKKRVAVPDWWTSELDAAVGEVKNHNWPPKAVEVLTMCWPLDISPKVICEKIKALTGEDRLPVNLSRQAQRLGLKRSWQ